MGAELAFCTGVSLGLGFGMLIGAVTIIKFMKG